MIKNLLLRTATGAAYVAVVLAGLLLGPLAFLLLCCALGVLAVAEYSLDSEHMQQKGLKALAPPERGALALDLLAALALIASCWLLVEAKAGQLLALWPLALLARMVYALFGRQAQPMASLAKSLMGQVYIAMPLLLLQVLYLADSSLVVLLFVLIWVNDTGAYLVGVSMGRHRLCPRISPKKSWEGFFGGLLFCVAAAVAAKLLWPEAFFRPTALMATLGAMVAVFATLGDLLESLFKRSIGVKDSGKLLPGHGGILDRIDSLLMVAIAAAAFLLVTAD